MHSCRPPYALKTVVWEPLRLSSSSLLPQTSPRYLGLLLFTRRRNLDPHLCRLPLPSFRAPRLPVVTHGLILTRQRRCSPKCGNFVAPGSRTNGNGQISRVVWIPCSKQTREVFLRLYPDSEAALSAVPSSPLVLFEVAVPCRMLEYPLRSSGRPLGRLCPSKVETQTINLLLTLLERFSGPVLRSDNFFDSSSHFDSAKHPCHLHSGRFFCRVGKGALRHAQNSVSVPING